MRISDWSSDVCSSDLRVAHVEVERIGHYPHRIFVHAVDGNEQQDQRRLAQAITREEVRDRAQHRPDHVGAHRSEEHTSELQSLMRTSYAVLCLKKKTINSMPITHIY